MSTLKNKLKVWVLPLSLLLLIPNYNFAKVLNSDPCTDLTTGGLITGSQIIDYGEDATMIWHLVPPTSLTNSDEIEYQWMVSTIDPYDFATYAPIAGATSLNYDPGTVNQTSYFVRCARLNGCTTFPVETNLVTIEVLISLAVELTDFSLGLKSQFEVELNWETSSEFNHKHFEIERSENGREYMPVGVVNGNGTTKERHVYTFTDKLPSRGNFYYRLKSVENGGLVEYTSTLEVSNLIEAQSITKIFPNPVEDRVNIDFEKSFDRALSIELYNSNFKMVASYQLAAGEQLLTFDMGDKVNGIYFIKIPTIQGYRFQKIIRVGKY